MDITLQLKKAGPTRKMRDGSEPADERGDIIAAWRTGSRPAITNAGVKFFYVHITDVPNITAARRRRFIERLSEFDHVPDGVIDPKTGEEGMKLRNSRKWHIAFGAMPRPRRRALRRDGQITVPWATAQDWLRRKNVKIDRDPDDEGRNYDALKSVAITDGDVTNA